MIDGLDNVEIPKTLIHEPEKQDSVMICQLFRGAAINNVGSVIIAISVSSAVGM